MRSRTLAVIIAVTGTSSVLLMISAVIHQDWLLGDIATWLAIITCIPIGIWVIDYVGERRHEATVQRVLRVVGRADAERELTRLDRHR